MAVSEADIGDVDVAAIAARPSEPGARMDTEQLGHGVDSDGLESGSKSLVSTSKKPGNNSEWIKLSDD